MKEREKQIAAQQSHQEGEGRGERGRGKGERERGGYRDTPSKRSE